MASAALDPPRTTPNGPWPRPTSTRYFARSTPRRPDGIEPCILCRWDSDAFQIDLQQDRHGDQEDLSRLHDNVYEISTRISINAVIVMGENGAEKLVSVDRLLAVLLNEHNATVIL